jgi:hypothetical protein
VHWRIVELDIQDGSTVVLNRILDGCHGNDKYQGYGVKPGVTAAENWEDLRLVSKQIHLWKPRETGMKKKIGEERVRSIWGEMMGKINETREHNHPAAHWLGGVHGNGVLLTTRMTRNKKKILATLWNWNHKFLGIKDKGVYLAVRILLRVYVCSGRPSSSLNSGGKGMLTNNILPSASSSELDMVLAASARFSSSSGIVLSSTSSCRNELLPPECLFFSLEPVLLCILSMMEPLLFPPLLTVNFLVAHLDRLGAGSPPSFLGMLLLELRAKARSARWFRQNWAPWPPSRYRSQLASAE